MKLTKQHRELRERFDKYATAEERATIALIERRGKRRLVWRVMRSFVEFQEFYSQPAERGLMIA
jgi:hypothetical protein